MSGAIVNEYPSSGFESATSQIGLPFFASRAIRCPSMVPMNSVSPRIASPRFTRPQQTRAAGDNRGEYIQNMRPVAASSATT